MGGLLGCPRKLVNVWVITYLSNDIYYVYNPYIYLPIIYKPFTNFQGDIQVGCVWKCQISQHQWDDFQVLCSLWEMIHHLSRCISCWTWGFSNVMSIFRGVDSQNHQKLKMFHKTFSQMTSPGKKSCIFQCHVNFCGLSDLPTFTI